LSLSAQAMVGELTWYEIKLPRFVPAGLLHGSGLFKVRFKSMGHVVSRGSAGLGPNDHITTTSCLFTNFYVLSQALYVFPNCKKLPLNISCHIHFVDDMERKQKMAYISPAVDFCKNLFYPNLKIAKFCIWSCIEPGTIAYHKPFKCDLLQKLCIAFSDLASLSQESPHRDQLGAVKTQMICLLACLGHQVVHNIDLLFNLCSETNLRKTHLNIFYHSVQLICLLITSGNTWLHLGDKAKVACYTAQPWRSVPCDNKRQRIGLGLEANIVHNTAYKWCRVR
jgi:hypothetical protein